jgi:hypothetical protein
MLLIQNKLRKKKKETSNTMLKKGFKQKKLHDDTQVCISLSLHFNDDSKRLS